MSRNILLIWLTVAWLLPSTADAARLKDISRLQDARHNQLVGYGLVVGLNGTGDSRQTVFTTQSLSAMLTHLGVQVPATAIKVKNVAAVLVTVDLPPFVRPGDRVDALVSSAGDATSLSGGLLVQTPLMGADGQVYAVVQGPVSTGGYAVQASGSSATKNHPTVGTISQGALVECAVPTTLVHDDHLVISLNQPDFDTANSVALAINESLGAQFASVTDAGSVTILVPEDYRHRVPALISHLDNLQVAPDMVAKVVVNERTGTVVVGAHVTILPVAIAHGDLTVRVSTEPLVSQPEPFSEGQTVVAPLSQVSVSEKASYLTEIRGADVQELIRSLNAVKASPRDIIAILQAIKRSGALQAELEVI